MSTAKSKPVKPRLRRSLQERRVLCLAEEIFARACAADLKACDTTVAIEGRAQQALRCAKVFFSTKANGP